MNHPTVENAWQRLRRYTAARIALGRSGESLPTKHYLDFQLAHALARDAVHTELDVATLAAEIEALGLETVTVRNAARDRGQYLLRPDLGRRLDDASRTRLSAAVRAPENRLVIVLAGGLSAAAVQRHAVPVLQLAIPRMSAYTVAPVAIAELGRVALGDDIAQALGAEAVMVLIGERPGLSAPDSLGIYFTYRPRVGSTDAERNCISNVRPEGLSYQSAATELISLLNASRRAGLSGVGLKALGFAALPGDR
ncbi:MAG: ethanolamine ammonia-lyase subunit EutC [Bryobacteraceae bacterium]